LATRYPINVAAAKKRPQTTDTTPIENSGIKTTQESFSSHMCRLSG
jgi:hypothetical protein